MIKTQLVSKNNIELIEEEIPEIGKNEVLIQSISCGVCGSDLHAFSFSKGYEFVVDNVTLGHEVSGKIVKVGSLVSEELLNKYVVAQSMQYCNSCPSCLEKNYSLCEHNRVLGLHFDGGLAQYFKLDAKYVEVLPDDLNHSLASLAEPLTIGIHAINRLGQNLSGRTVLVQGPGIIGFFVSILCVSKGAKVYLSGLPQDYESRLSRAKEWGVIPHIVGETELNEKIDIIFECSGASNALLSNTSALKKNGKIVLVALYERTTEVFLTPVVRNEWTIIPSYGSNPGDYEEAIKFIQTHQKKLETLPSYYSIDSVTNAFTDSLNKQVMKAIIKFDYLEGNEDEYLNSTVSAN